MPNVLVTGGAGFLGARLARQLLAAGTLAVAGAAPEPVTRLTLVDRVPVSADLTADPRVTVINGELSELLEPAGGPLLASTGALAGTDVIFHLAAAVSAECEADFDLGMRANLRATELLVLPRRRYLPGGGVRELPCCLRGVGRAPAPERRR